MNGLFAAGHECAQPLVNLIQPCTAFLGALWAVVLKAISLSLELNLELITEFYLNNFRNLQDKSILGIGRREIGYLIAIKSEAARAASNRMVMNDRIGAESESVYFSFQVCTTQWKCSFMLGQVE